MVSSVCSVGRREKEEWIEQPEVGKKAGRPIFCHTSEVTVEPRMIHIAGKGGDSQRTQRNDGCAFCCFDLFILYSYLLL